MQVASEGGLAIAPGDKRRAFLAAAAVTAEGGIKAASDSLTNTQQDLYIPIAALSPKVRWLHNPAAAVSEHVQHCRRDANAGMPWST